VAPERFVAFLLGLFARVTLVLGVVGLYGVVSYDVGTRVRELGPRMALGAGGGRITGMVVGRSLALPCGRGGWIRRSRFVESDPTRLPRRPAASCGPHRRVLPVP